MGRVTRGTREPSTLAPEATDGLAIRVVTSKHDAGALLGGSLRSTVLRVALPAVASNLLITLFGGLDTFWVGRAVGSAGLAAVTTSLFWIWLIISIAEMVSIGLTAVAARRHGERNPGAAAEAVWRAAVFSLGLGLVVAVAGLSGINALFSLMRAPAEVAGLGHAYLATYLLASPLVFGYFVVDAAFRATGDTKTPLLLLGVSIGVTLLLDPVLILGLWGAPRMGIRGAAVATVTTRSLAFAFGIVLLLKRGLVRVSPVRLATIAAMCRVGLPTAATGVAFSLIYVALTRTATQFGTSAIAALGLGHRIESWLFMIGVGFGSAAAAIVGQNLGANQVERAERAGWITALYASAPGALFCVLGLTIPERGAGLFTHDAAVIAEAARYLRIAAWSQLTICVEIVLEGALGGAAYTVAPMVTSTAITAARIPLAVWAAARWGTTGIWWVISITAIGRALAMAAIWAGGRWKRATA